MSISISVIVPVYNTEKYLEDCLISLVEQTIPFYEIILVNDGSSDNSCEICEKYSEQYNNILLINQKNQGLSMARNNGMKVARGQYITFVDSDDFVSGKMNEFLINKLSFEPLDVLFYSADIKNEVDRDLNTNFYIRNKALCGQIMSGIAFFCLCYPKNYMVSACCAVYRNAFLKENDIYFPIGIYYEDNPFFVNTVLHADKVICVSEKLYIRRYRENSIMVSGINLKKCEDLLTVQVLQWGYLKPYYASQIESDFIEEYILERAVSALSKTTDYKEQLVEKYINFIKLFMYFWHDFFEKEHLNWNKLYTLNLIICYWRQYIGTEENKEIFYTIENKFRQEVINKLQKVPMQEKIKVGIYGIGKHTSVLLDLYAKFIGTIKSDFFFIVTEKNNNSFMGKMVVSCSEIPSDTDKIVISSRIYQTEMKKQLISKGVNKNKILELYNSEDKYDLVLAEEIL